MRCFWVAVFVVFFVALASAQQPQSSEAPKPGAEGPPAAITAPSATSLTNPDAQLASIHQMIDAGQVSQAIFQLQQMRSEQPTAHGVTRELALAYYKTGDYAHAIPELKRALDEYGGDKEATQLLGLALYFTGKPKEAIPHLEAVQSWYPRANVDASYVLGLCYIQSLRYEEARKAFATMYDVPPNSAAAHLFNARMLLRQGYDPIAEQEAKSAIVADPKLPMAHLLLGEYYLFKSRIPEAVTELKAELAINPGHAATYYTLADAYTRLMQWDDAQRLLQRSIWLDSSASGPYILMGKVLLHKKDYVLAERTLRRALNMDQNNYLAHYLLGQTLRATDRAEEAEREMKRSQELQAAQTHGKVEVQQ